MSFVKNLAKGGLMGLGGLAATGAFKKKKQPSLVNSPTATSTTGVTTPSLMNDRTIY